MGKQNQSSVYYRFLVKHFGSDTIKGKLLNLFLGILICLNVLAIIVESIPSFHAKYVTLFVNFEFFSVMIFTIEYILRVWFSTASLDPSENIKTRIRSGLKYLVTPSAIIDLLSILPFYLSFWVTMDLRFLRVLRLFRIFKLTRYSPAINALTVVLIEKANALSAAFFLLCVLLISVSSGIYLIEHEVQPHAFGTIPDAMWWAMATLTTVGYGDVTPITPLGKFFGGCVTLIGMGMVALPAGILASGFSEQVNRHKQRFTDELMRMLEDGELDEDEKAQLKILQNDLDISDQDAFILIKMMNSKHEVICPHCHKSLSEPPESEEHISIGNTLKF